MFVIHRAKDNPILLPVVGHPWEAMATFKWCPAEYKKSLYCLYRAMTLPEQMGEAPISQSSIGRALLPGPCQVEEREQLIKPDTAWDKFGCEDPRVTWFEGKFYIFYTALSQYPFSADGIKVGVAVTRDLKKIEAKHPVTPFNAKAMALFPERVGGKVVVVMSVNTDRPPTYLALALFDEVEDLWQPEKWQGWYENLSDHILPVSRTGDDHVEVGAAPVLTERGWLLIYSHIQHYFSDGKVFGIEALLLDRDNLKIIGRTDGPLMVTEELYEKIGFVHDIVFPSGARVMGDRLEIYYGAADTVGCVARVKLSYLLESMGVQKPAGKIVKRYEKNPILEPRGENKWESKAVFNPAAIDLEGRVYILYRAMADDDTSMIGCAISRDGLAVEERLPEPVYWPREDFEVKKQPGNSGCEDARIVQIKDRLWMTYTALNTQDAPRVAITSILAKDFIGRKWEAWARPEAISPSNIKDKNSCLMPEKISGKYMLLHRIGNDICADYVSELNFEKEKLDSCLQIMQPRPGMWDSQKVGISAPPLKVNGGWLLFYHGVSERTEYRLGAALLDQENPTLVLARTAVPIFEPEAKYEKEGLVPNVVFPCGAVRRGDTIFIYYGGADKVVGVATASLKEIIKRLGS